MGKAVIDVKELRKVTERNQCRAESRSIKKQIDEDREIEKKAKKIANEIIRGLPEKLKAASRKGENHVRIFAEWGHERIDSKVRGKISSWCWDQGLNVDTQSVRYSDDSGLEKELVISWEEKK